MLLIALSLSEREGRRRRMERQCERSRGDGEKGTRAERAGDRGGRAHCTALITAL